MSAAALLPTWGQHTSWRCDLWTNSLPSTLHSLTQQEPQLKVIFHWFYWTIPLMHILYIRDVHGPRASPSTPNTQTDLSFIPSFCVMLKSSQDISHQSCVLLSLHKHDKPNQPWLHMLYSLGPDFIALLKIFPPYCSEWRLRSGIALPCTPHLLGLRMEECSRLWKKTSLQLNALLPPNPPCLLALSQSRTANPRHLSRWDVRLSPHTSQHHIV